MRGATLVELIVVLLVLGIIAGVSAFAMAGLRLSGESQPAAALERGRAEAIRSGRAVAVELDRGSVVRFLPDGRALGAGVDLLTGEPDAQR